MTLHSFEVESVIPFGGDYVLDIAVQKSDRASDASGHWGMAKEISAVGQRRLKNEIGQAKKYGTGLIRQFLDVRVEKSEDCPRYSALLIDGVRVKESPGWLKERLSSCGLQPINNLVDAANFVMLETGQPLHVFDFDKIANPHKFPTNRTNTREISGQIREHSRGQIIIRRAKKGEKILGLDEKTYELTPEVLVIADSERPLAIAGIKGGADSGVSKETKTIVLEAANFHPGLIRRGSKILNLKTDASARFERNLDPNLTDVSIRRLADVIQKIAGGKVKGLLDIYPHKIAPVEIVFNINYANNLIGVDLPSGFYKDAFGRLFMKAEEINKSELRVEVPTVRRDIIIPEDLVEEAGRFYGYEKIVPRLPASSHFPAAPNDEIFWEDKICDVIASAGFNESYVYEFAGEEELAKFEEPAAKYRELENPISSETKYMAARPLIKYLKQAADNLRNFDAVNLFGIAKAFVKNGEERKHLIIVSAEKGSAGETEFYQLKGLVDELLESLGIAEGWYDDEIESGINPSISLGAGNQELRIFHPYRVAEIKIAGEKIGNIGEIHPAILQNIKAKTRIAAAEIDFEKLWQAAEKENEYRPISKYPAIIRDIAVLAPQNLKTEAVLNVIENTAGGLLLDTDLFDYFQDEEMEKSGRKNLAFHLKFESPERTLKDEEVDKIMEKIVSALEEKGWIVRK